MKGFAKQTWVFFAIPSLFAGIYFQYTTLGREDLFPLGFALGAAASVLFVLAWRGQHKEAQR